MVSTILTLSYLLVIAGSVGMVLFAASFTFSTGIADLKLVNERLLCLDGHQAGKCSWGAIILGTAGQLLACWRN